MADARQSPTFEQVPDIDQTDGPMACRLASAFFGDPLPWQSHVLDVALARDSRDKYVANTVGISIPRQNGKSWLVRARCFYGAVTMGENILYTCQHGDTADEMFADLSAPFEDEDQPELHDMLLAVRKTNGQQCIKLKNGGRVRFTTRTNSLARGKTYDVLIYDEAQDLTRGQQAASLPTISASQKHNTQVIYLGTPPDPSTNGFVFNDMHDKVHAGERPRVAWLEWGAEDVGDPNDKVRWYETNPSLGTLLNVSAVEVEADSMDAATFARERLGWWTPAVTASAAIPADAWQQTSIAEIGRKFQGVKSFGVKFSTDGSEYAMVGCKLRRDRSVGAVELVSAGNMGQGVGMLADFLAQRAADTSVVVVDGNAVAPALCDALAQRGVPKGYVVRPKAADVCAAAQSFLAALADKSVRHTPSTGLDDGARVASKRSIGTSGGWGFDGSVAIEAASLALWGARGTRRDPTRKQVLL